MDTGVCVGVYLPTKNRVELLKKAVDSVLNQTYQNFKLLIIDDGSTDETAEYLNSIKDPRVSFIRNDVSEKACKARNRAIRALDTELVTGLDDDDVFLPNRLEELIKAYDPKFAFVCSGYFWDYGVYKKSLFSKTKVISLSDALDLNQCSNQILVERKRLLEVGGFDPELTALQDHDLWVRLIAKYGSAFRVGKELYIVNDDQELERISSVENKLKAIDVFEQKHSQIMSKRNKENFAFYRKKIAGEKISLFELFNSTQYGLLSLKFRHAFTQNLNKLARYRLDYIHSGKIEQPLLNWVFKILVPLMATGGPGASRVILLSSCIFFLGASNTASFGSDFFILMLLNTMFSQSFGFFLLKEEYTGAFRSVAKQSLSGLLASSLILLGLYYIDVVSNLVYTIPLIVILHFYYLYRFQRIAKSGFFILAISECVIAVVCLFAPFFLGHFSKEQYDAPYLVYVVASLLGLLTLIVFNEKSVQKNASNIPVNKVFNIAVSTSASVFALFCFPYAAKLVLDVEMASYVALTISCFSIAMLVPRTQANKALPTLGGNNLAINELVIINKTYTKIIWVSCIASHIIASLYLIMLSVPVHLALYIPAAIMMIYICSQYGFIYLTTLSLRGKEATVAKLNLMVLMATALALGLLLLRLLNIGLIVYLLPLVCAAFILRNIKAKNYIVSCFKG
jgi:glycosyltransferase involved in cell wall biosynthesis